MKSKRDPEAGYPSIAALDGLYTRARRLESLVEGFLRGLSLSASYHIRQKPV